MGLGVVAGAIGGGALLGTVGSIVSGNKIADAQRHSADIQQDEFNQIKASLNPFISGGQNAFGQLQNLTGTNEGGNPLTAALTRPFAPTIQELQQTPGYQFTLNQGLQGVQNSFAAQGLANSGAALKGATQYAEGLAGTTYQQQFQNYWAQNQSIYNMLQGQSQLGAQSALGLGGIGANVAGSIGNAYVGAAQAQAGGIVGATNSISGAANNLFSLNLANNYLKNQGNSGLFG